jgi:hypothetical protein
MKYIYKLVQSPKSCDLVEYFLTLRNPNIVRLSSSLSRSRSLTTLPTLPPIQAILYYLDTKKGPRRWRHLPVALPVDKENGHIVNVSWAIGKFSYVRFYFFSSFDLFLLITKCITSILVLYMNSNDVMMKWAQTTRRLCLRWFFSSFNIFLLITKCITSI